MLVPRHCLDILVCPECKRPLSLFEDESGFRCASCKRAYPVRDGIPVLLVEEATIAPQQAANLT
ncbi:MAG TPA: Trm112 family protein [Candidatus Eisenbacteria bacterium]|nr:Trm112 family protein [Candidatus Eisenbacteria bacterium]